MNLQLQPGDVDKILQAGKEETTTMLNQNPEFICDLRVGWDLGDSRCVTRLWPYLEECRPLLVVVSPPRKPVEPADATELQIRGRRHLQVCAGVCRWQAESGSFSLMEQLAKSKVWTLPLLEGVRSLPGVETYEMPNGIGWSTNSQKIAHAVVVCGPLMLAVGRSDCAER